MTRALKTLPGPQLRQLIGASQNPGRGCDLLPRVDMELRAAVPTQGRGAGTDLVQPRPIPAARGRRPAPSLSSQGCVGLIRSRTLVSLAVPKLRTMASPRHAACGERASATPVFPLPSPCAPRGVGTSPGHLSLMHFQMRKPRLRVTEWPKRQESRAVLDGGHGNAQGQGPVPVTSWGHGGPWRSLPGSWGPRARPGEAPSEAQGPQVPPGARWRELRPPQPPAAPGSQDPRRQRIPEQSGCSLLKAAGVRGASLISSWLPQLRALQVHGTPSLPGPTFCSRDDPWAVPSFFQQSTP